MITPAQQLDKRFEDLRPLVAMAHRPSRGWVRALREALGMTTGQLAKRMRVKQPRVNELERAEQEGKTTVQSLERAAEAMGCRLVYVLIPQKSLVETLHQRASLVAEQQLSSVEQSMRLESQGVLNPLVREQMKAGLVQQLLRKPARLWDEA
ncbi:MAG: mobile mystery protein A [Proteobacteria bacterium]|nr:mobile mystery protein A [Pseudomonadota bacterium]